MSTWRATVQRISLSAALACSLAACDGGGGAADGDLDAGADVDVDADADAEPDADLPPCPDDMVMVDDGIASAFCIDRYEHPGLGLSPSAGVTWRAAREACVEVRKELCVEEQWQRACVGTSPAACLGPVGPSGLRTDCVSAFGVFDMAGNVAEWTATPGGSVSWFACGGSASTSEIGCDFCEELRAESTRSDIGLRCCRRPRR
jgi:hypothetical protein